MMHGTKNIRRIFVCPWPVADTYIGSADPNDRLDVAQFLWFCNCRSELFYERGSN